jgi:hypothetical protein
MMDRASERIEYLSLDSEGQGPIYNISATGISCVSQKAEALNSIVQLKVNDLVISSKVIYCQKRIDGFRLGLQFWKVDPKQQKLLGDYVEGFSKGVPVHIAVVGESPKTKA